MKKDNLERIDELILRISAALKEAKNYDLADVYVASEDLNALIDLRNELTGTGSRMTKSECQEIIDSFNRICSSLPKVETLTEARQKAISSAVKTLGNMSFTEYFKTVEESDFLTGRANGWRGCGFDWILKKSNMVKVIEGNYNNKKQPAHSESSFDIDEFYAAALARTQRRMTNGKANV